MPVVSKGSTQLVVQSSVDQTPVNFYVLLVWFFVVYGVSLFSSVFTKYYILSKDVFVVLIVCDCDVCAS